MGSYLNIQNIVFPLEQGEKKVTVLPGVKRCGGKRGKIVLPMTPVKKRWTIILSAAALLGGAYFAAVKITPKYLGPEKISDIITQSFKDKLNRRVKFTGVHYGGNELVIDNFSVEDRAEFGGGDFFKARKLVCAIDYADLRGRKLAIRELRFEEPELYLRRKTTGGWNFSDLPETFAKPTKLPVEWSIGSYSAMGGKLQVQDDIDQNYLSLSTFTASFAMSALTRSLDTTMRGKLNGFYKGESMSGDARFNVNLGMENGQPSEVSTAFSLKSLVWKNIILGSLDGKIAVKGVRARPTERSTDISLEIKDMVLDKIKERAAAGGWEQGFVKGVGMYAMVKGVAVPDMQTLSFDTGKLELHQSSMTWTLSPLDLQGRDANLHIDAKIDAAQKTADSTFVFKLGEVGFNFAAQGPLSGPKLKPQMSSTVEDALNQLFSLIEKSFTNYYS